MIELRQETVEAAMQLGARLVTAAEEATASLGVAKGDQATAAAMVGLAHALALMLAREANSPAHLVQGLATMARVLNETAFDALEQRGPK